MSTAVVVDKNNTVVTKITESTFVLNEPKDRVVITGIMGPPGASNLSDLSDVDTTNLAAGSVLSYNLLQQVWQATNSPDNLTIDCGSY